LKAEVFAQLQSSAATNLGDFFVFTVGRPLMALDAAPEGGSRYPVIASLSGRQLLVNCGAMDWQKVERSIHTTFNLRQTHEIPESLPEPPNSWEVPYRAMAEECGLNLNLD
jgi:hypothetical protein